MRQYGKQTLSVVVVLAIIILSFGTGVYIGLSQGETDQINGLTNTSPDGQQHADVDFDAYWRVWNALEEKYVPAGTSSTSSISVEEKLWGSIQGLTRSLKDPYTVFLPPQDSKAFEEDISGNFEGVGMEIGERDGVLTVIAPLEGTPAKQAGIQTRDRIVEIDGQTTQGMSVDESVKRIRGEKGTTVTFTIIRDDESEPLTISVVRAAIDIPTINSYLREDGIFVIQLYNFSQRSPVLFRQSMKRFVQSGSDKLIVDVRQNPGGYLTAAVDIASYFLPEGGVVVREDFGDKREEHVWRSKGYNVVRDGAEIIVLIDGGSASASEILAGALSEHGKATLVGERTFGKGSVQELVQITDNPKTSLKVTIAQWVTPGGRSISNNGLEPEVEVERTPEQYAQEVDPQMEKAIEILNR
ncbi:MAG: S41 family peptidase [Candidatus Paceibacterota bacterium]